ncbi:MAG: MoxR family ATPase [Planctomycetes bacterium]|nr:MoxR family ATPase [Planctomycetota bacterium]
MPDQHDTDEPDVEEVNRLHEAYEHLRQELGKVVVGQQEVIEQLLIAMFAGGHCLLVGVPGLAKTLLVRTLAEALSLDFNRIQFTPDLMPADITGTEVIQENRASGERSFRFLSGPVFANVVLADEINRTPPKTQAALLEAMQEQQVTIGGERHLLPQPFFVLATQNPIEQEGTYPLPEAQLDRFMFEVLIDYPSEDEELQIVKQTTAEFSPQVTPTLNAEQIQSFAKLIRRIPVADHLARYALRLVRQTRLNGSGTPEMVAKYVSWGAGPRASQYLVLAAKARAALQGRYCAGSEDIQAVAAPVLRHRIIANFSAEADGVSTDAIIKHLLETTSDIE